MVATNVKVRLSAVGATLALVAVCVLAAPSPASATAFPDVPLEHPFAVPIDWAVTTGVTSGYGDGTFRPTVPVSRQAFAAFLARYDGGAAGSEPEVCEGDGPFDDVAASHPFCAEISWLVDLGITTGFGDGTFRPTDAISRQAMAAFLARYAADEEPEACEDDGPFDDVPASHPFCVEITWMVDQGITTGFDDNTFRPTTPISRQAAAAFLWRLAGEPAGATVRVSVTSEGQEVSGFSTWTAISGDGTTVAFTSSSHELVPDDTNDRQDVFVHVLATGVTERVSVDSDGREGDGDSSTPSLSADGRYVAFHSTATNLVPGEQGVGAQVFVHDRVTGTTERISSNAAGHGGDGSSLGSIISGDGRYVAFESHATDLVDDDKNGVRDVFVHDRQTETTELISRAPGGELADAESWMGSMSADGRFVSYVTTATNVVAGEAVDGHAVLHDREKGTNELLSQSIEGVPAEAGTYSDPGGISADGSVVVFYSDASNLVPGDDNDDFDVFVLDRSEGTLERLSVASDGTEADEGSFTGQSSVSADGRFVVFSSDATNLVPGRPEGSSVARANAYVHDRRGGTTELVSRTYDGGWLSDGVVNGVSNTGLAVSGDGRRIVFSSSAASLVPNDTNGVGDAFVHTRFGVG